MAEIVQTTTAGVVNSHLNDYRAGSRFSPSDYPPGSRFRLAPFSSLLERHRQVALPPTQGHRYARAVPQEVVPSGTIVCGPGNDVGSYENQGATTEPVSADGEASA